ncbi:MAG: homoserine dehydrogenase, partial [Clostridia bacterium]|nr:homoserine dehydrogenase [Clostridia bacterium]
MKKIAILGFGIVGGGIPTILEKNADPIRRAVGEPVGISYILDLRDFPDSPYADRVVHELAPILAD